MGNKSSASAPSSGKASGPASSGNPQGDSGAPTDAAGRRTNKYEKGVRPLEDDAHDELIQAGDDKSEAQIELLESALHNFYMFRTVEHEHLIHVIQSMKHVLAKKGHVNQQNITNHDAP